jgi:WD40 repeat protein
VRSFDLPAAARSMKLCANGKAIVVISVTGDEMVWLREEQPAIRVPGVQFVSAALSADGLLAAVADEFGHVTVWEANGTGAVRRASFDAGSDPVTAIAFAGEGSLVTGARNSTVRIWRWSDGAALSPTLHVSQTVAEVAASADGDRVAAACENGTTVVWGFKGWKAFTMPKASGRQVTGITFSSDGSRLWISWGNGRLDMHPLPPATLPPPDFAAEAERAIGLRLGENDIEEVVPEK